MPPHKTKAWATLLCLGFIFACALHPWGCTPPQTPPDGNSQDSGTQDSSSTQDSSRQDRTEPTEQSADQPPLPAILRAKGIIDISAQITIKEWPLPSQLQGTSIVALQVQSNDNPLFGNSKGLFALVDGKIKHLNTSLDVLGVARWFGGEMVIATPQSIVFWQGKVEATTLFAQLDGSDITTIQSHVDETAKQATLWIGTKKSLWQLTTDAQGSKLAEFSEVIGVKSLKSIGRGTAPRLLLVVDQAGQQLALQEGTDGWSMVSLSSTDIDARTLAPRAEAGMDFWALTPTQGLYLRKQSKDKTATWWPFRLKPDAATNETLPLSALTFHPNPLTTWGVGAKSLYRLSETLVGQLPKPANLGTATFVTGTDNGFLWLADDKGLYRVGTTSPPPSFQNVAGTFKASCAKSGCHVSGAQPPALTSYEEISKYIADKIAETGNNILVERISRDSGKGGLMPLGGPRLPQEDIDRIQKWVNGGMLP